MEEARRMLSSCALCPRACKANRANGEVGFCKMTDDLYLARAALPMWEEHCITGETGSGAIFFTGCNLGCVFCQNYDLSHRQLGKKVSRKRLLEIFYELKEQGACNINLVTSDVYVPIVAEVIKQAKDQGFDLPFVFNTSSYLQVESVKLLDGLIDIYLPDFKFYTEKKSIEYLKAPGYPAAARACISEMVSQLKRRYGKVCDLDEKGQMKHGVIVRHLLMPGGLLEAKMIVKDLYQSYKDQVYFSLLNQYTPLTEHLKDYPKLRERVREREYQELVEYACHLGISKGYMQEGEAISESFIPAFDFRGV